MNLVLDLGNTLAKLAVFKNDELQSLVKIETGDHERLIQQVSGLENIGSAIFSSVVDHSPRIIEALARKAPLIVLDHKTPVPLVNKYDTPGTLGRDRLAAAAGAIQAFPGERVLAIDAGTAIKYDLVTEKGEYLGGAISPGITMRFKALNTFTGKLPLLNRAEHFALTGTSTSGSIISGVQNGVTEEVKGMIARFAEEAKALKVVITGGDMDFFLPLVSNKSSIFADPYLALKGLNFILNHNASK